MKAPVGLLSDRTVCDSRWRGLAPTSSRLCNGVVQLAHEKCEGVVRYHVQTAHEVVKVRVQKYS